MGSSGKTRRRVWTGTLLLLSAFVGTVFFAVPTATAMVIAPETFARGPESKSPQELLTLADSLKTSDHDQFVKLLSDLARETSHMTPQQTWYWRYLVAWQVAYSGDYDHAQPLLKAVIDQSSDDALRFRATATLINILGISRHYEEAFSILNRTLDDLPHVSDKYARFHATAEAAQLFTEAGQYDLAVNYASQIVADYPQGRNACVGYYMMLHAEFAGARMRAATQEFQRGIDVCLQAGEGLITDSIRRDLANYDIQRHRTDAAIVLLQGSYANVLGYQYPDLTTEYNALLAQAYWDKNDVPHAEQYAQSALKSAVKGEFNEPLSLTYKLLYQIAERKGDLRDALDYHEQYMAADTGELDEAKEKVLAYQMVKQQVDAKKAELQELNKQNEILQLQRALDHKAVETSRLYIALLLTVLASIGFWLFRLKQSQLRFMRLARRDGLTDIFNRQHFVDEAEQSLRYVAKSFRSASLVLIDLDHFKSINDTYGHEVGDQVLKRAVAICQHYLHSSDVFGRLGGEEFGILLPECDHERARDRAEQVRAAIHAEPASDSHDITISASFGIASTLHHGYELRKLLLAADEALYRAKRDGRNRVVVNHSYTGEDATTPNGPPLYGMGGHAPWADPTN
jgi:diguanylate cyclase (GGDEF)-like protein